MSNLFEKAGQASERDRAMALRAAMQNEELARRQRAAELADLDARAKEAAEHEANDWGLTARAILAASPAAQPPRKTSMQAARQVAGFIFHGSALVLLGILMGTAVVAHPLLFLSLVLTSTIAIIL